jgi:methylenetetrahydrofolate dehydrogenase (NADP+)/methenyltetrahydrofolate cyclohydrolase
MDRMSASIIDGRALSLRLRESLSERIKRLSRRGIVPGLFVLLAGSDPASQSYVNAKEKACREIGIRSFDHRLPEDAAESELLSLISEANADPDVHGILVQLPLPGALDQNRVIGAVDPGKDVDAFHPLNAGRLLLEQDGMRPCTPLGILHALEAYCIPVEGSEVVILGRSSVVGKPLANLLLFRSSLGNATVTVCHSRTRDLGQVTRRADILIAAAGQPGLVTADMVKEGAVVIDVGVHRIEDTRVPGGYRVRGDVDFESVREKASFITPVPGGVGPLTISMLLHNTVVCAERAAGTEKTA